MEETAERRRERLGLEEQTRKLGRTIVTEDGKRASTQRPE